MDNVPNIKSHPVVMSLVTITFVLGISLASATGGWFLRAAMESKAELSVVVDDNEFMQALDARVMSWTESFKQNQKEFYDANKKVPDCLAEPMPDRYHSNDYRVRSTRESERELFDDEG